MSHYQQLITEAINKKASTPITPEDAAEIEEYMRHTIFHSTLDWQTRAQLQKAARTAWGDIQFMRSPEGQKYMASLMDAL